ncbi:flavin reductase family protein [Streptomyces sp. NPDC002795]|uniref:flavin reductase family protein n=1 Tax=Streptomyces sp. NPDC002795 TaxID=3364665 RepID=UPI0036C7E430
MTAQSVTPPETEAIPWAPTPARMRQTLGAFATGVTVITGTGPGGAPVGFACQSFASVSLDPPLVLFCADHRGRAWPLIRESGRFTVNVLADGQSDVCARFGSSRGRKYEGLEWEVSRWGTPSLPGALTRVHAEVHDVRAAGDHDVVIGRVLGLDPVGEGLPMLFFRGGFGVDDPTTAEVTGPWGWGDRWG